MKKEASIILSAEELSLVLNISEFTIKKLAKEKELLCTYENCRPLFNTAVISGYFEKLEGGCMSGLADVITQIRAGLNGNIDTIRCFFNANYPDTIKALRRIDFENTRPKRRKGFSLVKRESKKYGFTYYARFSHNGKTLPTKFNTHTNNTEKAEKFAMENKVRLVEEYLAKKDGRMYKTLEKFYEVKRNNLSEQCTKEYRQKIISKFIPFLKKEKIAAFEQIKMTTLARYRN